MAAEIIKETGAGVEGANCCFDLTELAAYYETHPYGAAVTALSTDQKTRCAITACREIAASVDLRGVPVAWDQSFAWPRLGVVIDVDPIAAAQAGPVVITGDENVLATGAGAIPGNVVPRRYVEACMEHVRFVAIKDRAKSFDAPAVIREKVDVIEREFSEKLGGNKSDLLPEIVQRMLKPFVISAADAGGAGGGGGATATAVRLVRG